MHPTGNPKLAEWLVTQGLITPEQRERVISQQQVLGGRIEEAVLDLLATQQPVLATDLRMLNATIAIAGELERAGDYAKGIAKRVERCLRAPALVEPPAELGGAAVTVMDGPFFSMMPYPSRGLFTLSHVRYTPHCNWHDRAGEPVRDAEWLLAKPRTRFEHMVRDAQRYLPAMRGARYADSLFEVKTVMPRSEQDDSRPILLRRCDEHPALLTVLGAKIDSVYDVEDALNAHLGGHSGALLGAELGGLRRAQ